jgi:hypothetical protein
MIRSNIHQSEKEFQRGTETGFAFIYDENPVPILSYGFFRRYGLPSLHTVACLQPC